MAHSNKVLFIKDHCKAILKCRRQSRSSLRWPVSQQYFWTIKTIMKMAPRNQTPPQNPRTPPEKKITHTKTYLKYIVVVDKSIKYA